jgi:hypothetical protein
MKIRSEHLRSMCFAALACTAGVRAQAPEAPVVPVSVCEVLRDLPAHTGKAIAVLGRYSFRENGRWLGEQACEAPVAAVSTASATAPASAPASAAHALPALWLVENGADGPRQPGSFELDAAAVRRKLAEVERRTSLGKFRFGTPDYDRWAVVWGRVEPRHPEDGKAAANLVIRGSGVILFLTQ